MEPSIPTARARGGYSGKPWRTALGTLPSPLLATATGFSSPLSLGFAVGLRFLRSLPLLTIKGCGRSTGGFGLSTGFGLGFGFGSGFFSIGFSITGFTSGIGSGSGSGSITGSGSGGVTSSTTGSGSPTGSSAANANICIEIGSGVTGLSSTTYNIAAATSEACRQSDMNTQSFQRITDLISPKEKIMPLV